MCVTVYFCRDILFLQKSGLGADLTISQLRANITHAGCTYSPWGADTVASISCKLSQGMNSTKFLGGTVIMDGADNITMAVDAEVLVRVFLKLLNNEGLINNKTYLTAEDELRKGENGHVNMQ